MQIFNRLVRSLCFMVFFMVILSGQSEAADPVTDLNSSQLVRVPCSAVIIMTGPFGQSVTTVIVMGSGVMFMSGKMSLPVLVVMVGGTAGVYGAEPLMNAMSGGELSCKQILADSSTKS